MASGAFNSKGVWIYGEDDSEATFSALLNKLGNSVTTALGSGRVLQVVTAKTSTLVSRSSTAYDTTGLTATITPSSTTSKIIVIAVNNGVIKFGVNSVNMRLVKGTSTVLATNLYVAYAASGETHTSNTFNYEDIPGTTSPVTYKTEYASGISGQSVSVQGDGCMSGITLIEVAA